MEGRGLWLIEPTVPGDRAGDRSGMIDARIPSLLQLDENQMAIALDDQRPSPDSPSASL